MAEKRYQVFISSTYDDLKDQRFQILRALLKDGDYIPVGMESFPASGDDQFECIKEYIDASDYYIVIIAGRYGTPTSDGVSYTEKEFDYAEAKLGKKYVLAFPKRNPTYEEENIQKLVDFRTRAIKGRGANFWDNDSEPTSNILNTLKYAVRHDTRPNAGWIRACEAPTETELAKQLQAARDKLQQAEQERDGYRHRVDQLAGALQKLYAERDLIQKTMIIAQKTADDLAAPAKSRPAVGSTYHFGNYDWRVLEVRDGKALLITKEVIDEKPYNEKWKGVTWETCTLRGYLNGEFYESFSEADRAKIVETTVKTPDSGYTAADGTTWSAPGGNET
ncbi:MAG: DUF4062 domain-containing protein, partial [Oscillospiraceae bacterium]|nr:DUF4062 domain-containing protein [Oscillospiraceae bacterium]